MLTIYRYCLKVFVTLTSPATKFTHAVVFDKPTRYLLQY